MLYGCMFNLPWPGFFVSVKHLLPFFFYFLAQATGVHERKIMAMHKICIIAEFQQKWALKTDLIKRDVKTAE